MIELALFGALMLWLVAGVFVYRHREREKRALVALREREALERMRGRPATMEPGSSHLRADRVGLSD